jgi:hypothetical protein
MATNDQIILDKIIEEQHNSRMPTASKAAFFEMYVAEQILKDYDLSDDEIESGIVGDGADGGIDCIYTFANGDFVQEDFDYEPLKRNVHVEVWIIQSKTSPTFGEDTMNKLVAVTKDLFDLSRPVSDFSSVYNDSVRANVEIFRRLYTGIAARFPRLQFRYLYATRGDSSAVHPNVSRKADDIARVVSGLFSSAAFEFRFVGASDLLELAHRQPVSAYDVQVIESLSAKDGTIALVRLKDLDKFLRDDDAQLRKNLFEANVRDYQGTNQVNEEIQHSLREGGNEDFWWLNNGITIVASKAVQSSKVLTIEDPQIVNGQQTSTEIFNYFTEANTTADERTVMVRVIVVTDPASRDRIIKATNSQTSIPAASLRATDKIHRDIEVYLSSFGIYYDRRKNSHKNLGRPAEQIISISLMAQSIMAIALQRPADARARPSSLLKNDGDYRLLFSPGYPIELYLVAAKIIKSAQIFLRSHEEMLQKDRTNLLFYIVLYAIAHLTGRAVPAVAQIALIRPDQITPAVFELSLNTVRPLYEHLGASDQIAKGTVLLADLKQLLVRQFTPETH